MKKKVKDAGMMARLMAGLLFAAVIGAFAMCLLMMFSARMRMIPDKIQILLIAICGVSAILAAILHYVIFPHTINDYPVYSVVEGLHGNMEEKGKVAQVVTKPRMIGGCIALAMTLLFSVLLAVLWPVGTAPKTMPMEVSYLRAGALSTGDFGTVAYFIGDTPEDEALWVCAKVDCYGPFDFNGTLEEISFTSTVTNRITKVDSYQDVSVASHSEVLYVKFNHYEDGTWMIVKCFRSEDEPIRIEAEDDAAAILSGIIQSRQIPYTTHDLSTTSWSGILRTLDTATNDFLIWERTKDGIAWDIPE